MSHATIGSGDEDAIPVAHPSVSPGHAAITWHAGRFHLTTWRAGAEVRVDGRTVAPGSRVPLEPGQVIAVGAVQLRWSSADDEDMKPPG